MKAIDEHNPDPSKKYRIESSEREYDGDGNIADVVSIFELSEKSEVEIYRFYEFKYGRLLTQKFRESNILYRFVCLLLVLLTRFLSVLKAILFFKNGINGKSKIQALYFTIIYCTLAVYLVLLIPSLLGVLISFAGDAGHLKPLVAYTRNIETELKAVLTSFSAFMLFVPNSKNIFSDMAIEYLAANQYLSIGDRRQLIMGKLNRLTEVIFEESDCVAVEFHAYSFGSVLAIDALFPYESEPSYRVRHGVGKLVTIGCPFDFIEIYWSNYFSDRKFVGLSLAVWRNINSDLDVLSTKFDNSPSKQASFISSDEFWRKFSNIDVTYNMVNPKQVSFTQMLMFYGLKAHQTYWDKHADSKSCLSKIVEI